MHDDVSRVMLNWSGCQACHDGGQQANSWVADHKKATTLKTSISPSHFQAKFNLKTHYTKRKEREKKIVISGFIFLSVAFFSTVPHSEWVVLLLFYMKLFISIISDYCSLLLRSERTAIYVRCDERYFNSHREEGRSLPCHCCLRLRR